MLKIYIEEFEFHFLTLASASGPILPVLYSIYPGIKDISKALLTLFLLGGNGGQFDPPCSFFYITQKVLV